MTKMTHGPVGRLTRRGFTLIELLVSITIISILIGLLLPSLARSRNAARLLVSVSNCQQLLTGMAAYRNENREWLPLKISGSANASFTGWSTWSYGGKWCDQRWASADGGLWDEPPPSRPLNSYIYPSANFDTVGSAATRAALQLSAFRSPGDTMSFQWYGNYPTPDPTHSSYDDVGTSYHTNMKWWYHLEALMPQQSGETTYTYWTRLMQAGVQRMNVAANFDASRFVWIHDQTGDVVAHDPQQRHWMGEFGDRDRSVMSFMDGHAKYINVIPGQEQGPDYIFFFPLSSREATTTSTFAQ